MEKFNTHQVTMGIKKVNQATKIETEERYLT